MERIIDSLPLGMYLVIYIELFSKRKRLILELSIGRGKYKFMNRNCSLYYDKNNYNAS